MVSRRKRFATTSVLKAKTNEALQNAFRTAGPAQAFRGTLNESRRMFIFSADMWTENAQDPWSSLSSVQDADIKLFTEFAKSLTGPTDIAVFFDGRHKTNARQLHAALRSRQNVLNIWLLFGGPAKTTRTGKVRRVIYSAATVEQGWVMLPCSPTKFSIQEFGTECEDRRQASSLFLVCSQSPFPTKAHRPCRP